MKWFDWTGYLPQKTTLFSMDIYNRKQGYFQQIFTNEKELILVDLCPRKLADFQMISASEIDEIFSRFLAKKINWI